MRIVLLVTTLLALVFSLPVVAQMSSEVVAYRAQEMLNEDIALSLAPIRSQAELQSYLRTTPKSTSPLERLSPAAKKRFLASLSFNENGITGFSYDDLESELTASQIYQVLSLFGAQHITSQLGGARVEAAIDEGC